MKYLYLFSVCALLSGMPAARGERYCTCSESGHACAAVVDPVCGINQCTFINDCERHCARIPLLHKGQCRDDDDAPTTNVCGCSRPGWFCPYIWDPECGVDGCTYPNRCVRKCAGVPLWYPGECIHTNSVGSHASASAIAVSRGNRDWWL